MTAQSQAMRRLTARFTGHVQGVGFRYTTVELAMRMSLTGYVANLMNGDVELVAEGPEQHLLELVQQVQRSHLGRYILHVDQQWSAAKGEFNDFDVRFGG